MTSGEVRGKTPPPVALDRRGEGKPATKTASVTVDGGWNILVTSSAMAINPTQPSRDVDAGEVAARLGVSLPCLREHLGSDEQGMSPDLTATAFQSALRPVSRALEILESFFHDSEAVKVWLRTPHPDLDGSTALEAILDHQAQAVCILLENALSGVPV